MDAPADIVARLRLLERKGYGPVGLMNTCAEAANVIEFSRVAIAEFAHMHNWHSINTAPMDKTMVALLHKGSGFERYGVGWYMPLVGWQAWDRHDGIEPTHWSPLPPASNAPESPATTRAWLSKA